VKRALLILAVLLPLLTWGQQYGNGLITVRPDSTTVLTGCLIYRFSHGFMFFRDSATVIIATQNVWYKVNNATNSLWQLKEFEHITKIADTVRIDSQGDYWGMFTLRLSSANQLDRYQLGVFVNGALEASSTQTLGANNGQITITVQWYFSMTNVGDMISLRVRNMTNNNDPTLIGGSFYMYKIPEH